MPAQPHHVEIEGRSLALSNLDKILYPASGFAKAPVIDYYVRIAPWLLPHFSNRPVTMKRFPDGVQGKAFYEKDAPKHIPSWIRTTEVPRQAGGKPIRNDTGLVLAKTELSESISAALKKRGFKFVGPTIVYAWMQAVGMVNDHSPDCFRRNARRPASEIDFLPLLTRYSGLSPSEPHR